MAKRLLTLTFHKPAARLREDALFKKHGLATPLLSEEALGDGADIPDAIQPDPSHAASGVDVHDYSQLNVKQVTLNGVGINAWWRAGFISPKTGQSSFEEWLTPKVSPACDCLVLGGHHGGYRGGVVLWGQEDRHADSHRWYTALVPKIARINDLDQPVLEIRGNPYRSGSSVLRAGHFECLATLSRCRLVLVMGCNGTGWSGADGGDALGFHWQAWVAKAAPKKPIILGWYGLHRMPSDRFPETLSKTFWQKMAALAAQNSTTDLTTLCKEHAIPVIEVWGSALKETFANGSKEQRHLWFGRQGGGGAIDPDGHIWKVLEKEGPIRKA